MRAPECRLKTKLVIGVIGLIILVLVIVLPVTLTTSDETSPDSDGGNTSTDFDGGNTSTDSDGGNTSTVPVTTSAAHLQTFSVANGDVVNIGVPVEEDSIRDHKVLDKKAYSSVITSETEWAKSEAGNLGIDFVLGMFSGSGRFRGMREKRLTSEQTQYVGTVEITAIFKKLNVGPSMMEKDPLFSDLLNDLGELKPNSSQYKLNAFYSKHGTNYLCEGLLGGRIYREFRITNTSLFSENKTGIMAEASAAFRFGISVSAESKETTLLDKVSDFESEMTHVEGGDIRLFNNYSSWLESVPDNLHLVKKTYCRIAKLIPLVVKQDHLKVQARFQEGIETYLKTCPTSDQDKVCSGFGICDFDQKKCVCFAGHSGEDCSEKFCKEPCMRGTCSKDTGKCVCNDGFYGESCNCTKERRFPEKFSKTFVPHGSSDIPVDYCAWRNLGDDGAVCGQEVANEFCRDKGYTAGASSFMENPDVGLQTIRMDNSINGPYECGVEEFDCKWYCLGSCCEERPRICKPMGFSYIECAESCP